MADIKDQLIKDSYNYVLQSDLSTGVVYRIGGDVPVSPIFQSGLTINDNFTYSNGTEQSGYVLTTDGTGYAYWSAVSASTPSSGVTSITVGDGLSANSSTGAVTIVLTGSTGLSGSGTTGYLPKWTGSTGLGDSLVYDSATGVTIGTGFNWNNTNGRLGVGTTNPTGSVTIIGAYSSSTAGTLVVQNTLAYGPPNYNQYPQVWLNSSGGVMAYMRNDGRLYTTNDINSNYFVANATGSASTPIFKGSGGNGMFFPATNTIAFTTNSTEVFRMFSTQNVSIGTTTDSGFKLDVNGTGRFTDNVLLSTNKGVYFGITGYGISGETGIGTVSLVTNSIQRLRIDNSGNINASTAPTAAISNIYISGSNIEFRNGLHYFSWENTGNVFQIKNISNSNTIPFIVFKSTNNIGIGKTSDSGQKLQVSGNTLIEGSLTATTKTTIGSESDISCALLQMASTTQGVLFPRMTNAQRQSISSPIPGLFVYCTDDDGGNNREGLFMYKSTGWVQII
jgi:hypothetical protein